MATTTPNFGWDVPQSTDLVKDGATAIAALGNDIDTSLVDLKGGTTGQVLSKASNTDLDFTWSSVDPLTILDAKGDLISATAADTPARLAVGTNDQVLMADSSTATGLKWGTISAGGMTLISTTTLSGASTTITSIPQTYESLYFLINGSTINEYYRLRAQPNSITNGASYVAGYGSTFLSYTNEEIYLQIENGEISNSANGCAFRIDNYTGTDWKPFTYFGSHINSGGSRVASWGAGAFLNSTNAITSMKFTSAGSFTGGTVKMYGVK